LINSKNPNKVSCGIEVTVLGEMNLFNSYFKRFYVVHQSQDVEGKMNE